LSVFNNSTGKNIFRALNAVENQGEKLGFPKERLKETQM